MLPKRPVGRAIWCVLPPWNGLARCREHGTLSIDNNLSERRVRPVAIDRKNHLYLGSDYSGKAAAILDSLMASAKVNSMEPFAYVCDPFVRLSGNRPDDLSELLPDERLKACRGLRRG